MTKQKLKQAETLFCAIGMIDDEIVAAAQSPTFVKRKTLWRNGVIAAVAACVALAIGVGALGTGMLAMLLRGTDKATDEALTLDTVLQSAADNDSVMHLAEDDIVLFSGKTSLIWQDGGEGNYCVVELNSDYDASRLKQELYYQTEEVSAEEAAAINCRVWVSFGDGKVVSPHLKRSAGNVGYGKLFDYDPELMPSDSLAELVQLITA